MVGYVVMLRCDGLFVMKLSARHMWTSHILTSVTKYCLIRFPLFKPMYDVTS